MKVHSGSDGGRAALALLLCALAAATGALALWSTSASAMVTPPYISSFGSFSNVQSIATDSATGDVYVYDKGAKEILKFDASGTAADFSATGTNAITGLTGGESSENELAVDNSEGPAKGDIYLVTGGAANHVLIFNEAGTKIGQLTSAGSGPWYETCGVATGPSGALYVSVYTAVDRFVPSASPLVSGDFASSISTNQEPCQTAVDAAGDVFTSRWGGGTVYRYPAPFGSSSKGEKVTGKGTSMTVDPATDELYVDEGSQVAEFGVRGEPFEAPVSTFAASGEGAISNSYGIAVSGFNHELYVSDGKGKVSVFGLPRAAVKIAAATKVTSETATLNGTVNPEGASITECVFEYGEGTSYGEKAPCVETVGSGKSPVSVHADISELAEATLYHFRLVVKDSEGDSWATSDSTLATLGPIVSGANVVEAGTGDIVVSASIDPNGASTTYQVQYGETAAYGSSTPVSAPVGSDTQFHRVTTTISGLAAGATYHLRFVATNEDGSAASVDREGHTYPLLAPSTGCANEALRYGFSAYLPDCRAYEQASPVDKNGTNLQLEIHAIQAAEDGGGITFVTMAGVPGGTGAGTTPVPYLATRGGGGWSTQGLFPSTTFGERQFVEGWTPSLSETLASVTNYGVGTGILLRDNATGAIHTILPYTNFNVTNLGLAGASSDGTLLYLEEADGNQLTSEAASGKPNLYVWDTATGKLSLAGVLPDSACGSPPCVPAGGSFAGAYNWWDGTTKTGGAAEESFTQAQHAISADGQRAYFTAGETGQIYLREDAASADAKTVAVSASQKTNGSGPGGADPNGTKPAAFMMATPDGSQAFFTSAEELTNDATTGPKDEGNDLYRFDAETGGLTDLTPDPADPDGADVQGVLGVSEDGSYVYFAANGDLDGSGPASTGDCHVFFDSGSGQCSLYLWHANTVSFIASLDVSGAANGRGGEASSDAANWAPRGRQVSGGGLVINTSRVSADGHVVVFRSQADLTAYESGGVPEFYRYDETTGKLGCITCNPSGAPASTGPKQTAKTAYLGFSVGVQTRNLSTSGDQFFFETEESLLPGDTNGVGDVYEWEADGAGSCSSAAEGGGCLFLLSTGTSSDPSYFGDASASGEEAFIFTDQPLVGQDEDELIDVYDVRAEGGLASQRAEVPAPCSGDSCKGAGGSPLSTAPPATLSLTGAGNIAPPQQRGCARAGKRAAQLHRRVRQLEVRLRKLRGRARSARRRHHGRKARQIGKRITAVRRHSRQLRKQSKRAARAAGKCRAATGGNGK